MTLFTKLKAQNDILDGIKCSVSIEDVAKSLPGLDLSKAGRHLLTGNCPTKHSSESGNCFKVFLDTNSCHCFNCGCGGSVIDLVMLTLNMSFKEALEWIIRTFHLEDKFDLSKLQIRSKTEEEIKKDAELRQKSSLYEEIVRFGKELLYKDEGKEALQYLIQERKYDEEILKGTDFIYLPDRSEVKRHLLSIYPDAAEAIRMLKLNGHFGDNFHLAFPYRNCEGLITGLLKRSSKPEGVDIKTYDGKEHKNVRWDSTPGLTKEDLFRLNECKKDIDTLVIVEGYPDAMYLSRLGLENIVAVGAGELSKMQLEALHRRKVKNVIISFDNDKVGPDNTESAVRLILEESYITPYVLNPELLSSHKDPDEYVRANGIEDFKNLLKKTEKGIFWIANRIFKAMDKSDPLSRKDALDRIFSLAQYIHDPVEMEEFKSLVRSHIQLPESAVKAKIKLETEKSRIELYKKIKEKPENGEMRYVPFIEKNTASYAYYDHKEDEVYLGIGREILENILSSAEQMMPEVLPVLKADFYIEDNNRINYEKERFNFFVPTEHMLLTKTPDLIDPRKGFPHIYKLLSNLFPKYRERKLFLNWLAGILQMRKKHLTAWLLKGDQGTGKNVLMERVLQPLFGHRQTKVIDDAELQRDFNPWLQNALIIAFNEVAHDNKTRNSINSKIKAIITDPTATINEKNVRAYTVRNHANCLFFSNESIPLFIENGDRRFNVVSTGKKLSSFTWFNQDPEGFLKSLEEEVPAFAQFLMNWKYDPIKANTCIYNEEKENMVDACMNRYEKFAQCLKKADTDWFRESLPDYLKKTIEIPEPEIKNKRIKKDTALTIFNGIYSDSESKTGLTQKLGQYGIRAYRDKLGSQQLYVW